MKAGLIPPEEREGGVVKNLGTGPLFYDPARHTKVDAKTTLEGSRGSKIAHWYTQS
jgi:hypothetical protein